MCGAGQGPAATPRAPIDSPEFWRAVVDSVPDLLVLVDRDGTLLYASPSLDGTCLEGAAGRSALDYLPADSREELRGSLRDVFLGAAPPMREHRALHPDGTEHWYAIHMAPVHFKGEIAAAVVVARDATAHHRLVHQAR